MSQVLLKIFSSIFSPGAVAGALGTAKLARNPAAAKPIAISPAIHGSITPASNCPPRMARNVPASINPVPPITSFSFRCWGIMAYFIGPNTVDCRPVRKRAASKIGIDCKWNPTKASAIMATSAAFTKRINVALS